MRLTFFTLFAALLFTFRVSAIEESHTITTAKPREGVFMLANGYSATVLELKDGHFRYWFESDAKLSKEPEYPLSGEYSVKGDTITLNHPDIYNKTWTFRTLDGKLTLWRPSAIKYYDDEKKLDCYGILHPSERSAEDSWQSRREPPKKK